MKKSIFWNLEFLQKMLVILLMCTPLGLVSCGLLKSAKSIDTNAICQNALVKVAVVIAAAQLRNIPVQEYVDGMCKVSSILEPFIKDALKADRGELAAGAAPYDPVALSLEAARKEGFVK
jgi:hypothetical protein